MIQIALLIFCTLVIIEFGLHVVYHAVTGKGGLLDPPFSYLKDIFRKETLVDRIKHVYLTEDTPVMSELCRTFVNELSIEDIRELLRWSGDDEFMTVTSDKDIVCRDDILEVF